MKVDSNTFSFFFGHIYCIVSIFSCEGGCNDVLFNERVGGGVGITLCLIYSEFFFGGGRGLVFYCRCFALVAAASVNVYEESIQLVSLLSTYMMIYM